MVPKITERGSDGQSAWLKISQSASSVGEDDEWKTHFPRLEPTGRGILFARVLVSHVIPF